MPVEQRTLRGLDARGAPRSRPSTPLRWFMGLSVGGRSMAAGALLLFVICALFAEENWRGRRAWAICRRDLDAKGALDWQQFVPAPVADEQNFAATPFLAPLLDFNPKPLGPG